ncbi:hypothetical protein [Streptomyces sp. MA5143a]|uniref:hypothetical protein n=1 Tax=Streptomyces sp. MA5143a TaxID=2083010 RepID=UPI000D1AD2E9|nr:hypothetical protein [Streptomyces sp. MA5143a]
MATIYRLTAGHRDAVAAVLTLVGAALGLAQPLVAEQVADASRHGQIGWPSPARSGCPRASPPPPLAAPAFDPLPLPLGSRSTPSAHSLTRS